MSDKYTKSARQQDCQIRIPNVCSFNRDETILAHLNGAGMGMKHVSIHGSYACANCHDAVDGRISAKFHGYSKDELLLMHYEGMKRTQDIMIKEGILKL